MSMRWTTVSDRDFTLMRDEFGNYSHSADKTPISFQEQKKILGYNFQQHFDIGDGSTCVVWAQRFT